MMNRLAYVTPNSMKIVSVYKSLPEYSICSFRGSLHRNSSENKKRKSEKSSHPISTSFFYISFSSLCKSLYSLSLTSVYMCFYSGESSQLLIRLLFLFFVGFLFLSLHCAFACFIIYLSFCLNKCLCQISALLHLNTQHLTKRIVYIYIHRETK